MAAGCDFGTKSEDVPGTCDESGEIRRVQDYLASQRSTLQPTWWSCGESVLAVGRRDVA